jgi:hypothetical protein
VAGDFNNPGLCGNALPLSNFGRFTLSAAPPAGMGSAWCIPTIVVPMLPIAHAMIFARLVRGKQVSL